MNCRSEAVNMVGEEAVRDFQQYLRISAPSLLSAATLACCA